ncbi:uncharacterized protein [Palaemon carinicauda]|uniref:uncharacterized protein n=1 Tax=Palaemon carinicauda TaxID=392227 RepID=UPI0035B6A674
MKIYSVLILKRLERKLDEKLRDEQAGFRKSRSSTDQIFNLGHGVQQCVKYRNSLLMAFVDYEKALDMNSGVLQGNVLSPMLFISLRGFVMRITVRDGGEGLDWIGEMNLVEIEYADDAGSGDVEHKDDCYGRLVRYPAFHMVARELPTLRGSIRCRPST